MSLDDLRDLPILKLPEGPDEIELPRDSKLDGTDLDRFVAIGGVVRAAGYRVLVVGGVTTAALNMLAARAWRPGNRVRVLRGMHEGRTGAVVMPPSSPGAKHIGIGSYQVQVALDGEPGGVAIGPGARAQGGRGGISVVLDAHDLEPYDGPAGRAVGKDRR